MSEYTVSVKYDMPKLHNKGLPCAVWLAVESTPKGCTSAIIPLYGCNVNVAHRRRDFANWCDANKWVDDITERIATRASKALEQHKQETHYDRLKKDQPWDYNITF